MGEGRAAQGALRPEWHFEARIAKQKAESIFPGLREKMDSAARAYLAEVVLLDCAAWDWSICNAVRLPPT